MDCQRFSPGASLVDGGAVRAYDGGSSWELLINLNNMNRMKSLVALLTLVTALPMMAQQKRYSPHETVSTVVDGSRVMVIYGRPYTKSPHTGEVRKIWGTLVPYGKVWRTGADEATLLITEKPLVFGDATVPAGAYTLWTLPQEDGSAKLIINKQIGQWGEGETVYKEENDVARVDLKKETLDTPVDQFTMAVTKGSQGGGQIVLSWENTKYTAPFTVQK
jgi:hypothetical protein